MRYAVFSDVHANLPALEAFIDASAAEADAYVCLGDVVGYGPWNDECLDRVLGLPGIVLLEGHHERLFSGVESVEREHPLVQEFFHQSRAWFTAVSRIRALPQSVEIGEFLCRHSLDRRRIRPDTPLDLERSHLIGHSHEPFVRACGAARLVSCGSVGQNRRSLDRATYALYDSATAEVRLRDIPYRAERYLRELEERRYSAACVEYVARKLGRVGADARAAG